MALGSVPLLRLVGALVLGTTSALAHTPHDVIVQAAASPSFAEDGVIFAHAALSEHDVLARSSDGGRTWSHQGHAMVIHGVTAFRFSPAFAGDGTCFAATSGGGVYVTRDGGAGWRPANDGLDALEVRDVAVSPGFADDRLVALATAGGCYLSADAGRTWSGPLPGLEEEGVTAVAFEAGEGPWPQLLVGGRRLYRLAAGNSEWASSAPFVGDIRDIEVQAGVLALVVEGDGVHVSTDGGETFVLDDEGLPDRWVTDLSVADDGTLFAATTFEGLFRSPGPGSAWVEVGEGLESPAAQVDEHLHGVQALPDFASRGTVVLAAFEGCFRSDDRGDTWAQLDVYNMLINRDIAVSPGFREDRTVFLGNYGAGVLACRLTDDDRLVPRDDLPAQRWSARGDNLPNMFSGPLAISPDHPVDGTLFSGHTKLGRSVTAGAGWKSLPLPLEVSVVRVIGCSPDYAEDGLVLFGTRGQGVWRSVDGGDSWSPSGFGLPVLTRGRAFAFSPAFATDRTVFYASRDAGVYRSTNGGFNWTATSTGLTDPVLRAMAISPDFARDGTLFVGAVEHGVFVSRDRGESWEASNTGLVDAAGIGVEGLAVSPGYAADRTVFLTSQRGGVFRSTDGGATWEPRNRGLTRTMPRRIALVPDFPRDPTAFVVTHDWVWVTRDGAETWQRLEGYLRVPDGHPQVVYEGPWVEENDKANHGRSALGTEEAGAAFSYGFQGRSIAWFATRGPDAGMVSLQLDDEPAVRLDLHAETLARQQKVWEADLGPLAWHTIRVEVLPSPRPDTTVTTDGFETTF